jgi:hypothetical protein
MRDDNCPNDPDGMRITASDDFVDSVAKRCPDCQIGAVLYASSIEIGDKYKLNALPLNDKANIDSVHSFLSKGRNKHAAGQKYHKTYTGVALDTAIYMSDMNYDSLVAKGMDRHIIIITDGDWQTPGPSIIYNEYTTKYPGRPVPTVHGIFIQNTSCSDTTYDLTDLYAATRLSTNNTPPADTTPGMYFPGTSASNIVATLDTLFQNIVIIDTTVINLDSVKFTNKSTGISQTASIIKSKSADNSYIIKVPDYTLNYGINTFIITMKITDTSGILNTRYDTLTIIRNTNSGSGTTTVFNNSCFADSVQLSISCNPSTLQVTSFDTIMAHVNPEDTSRFAPNNILVRAFTPFADNEANTIALFHLNNDLVNSVTNGTAGSGSPVFTSSNAAFGLCLSSGSFQTSISSTIGSGDFTIECWIKPPSANQAATIASGTGFSFSLTSDGYLSTAIGSITIKTNHIIDKAVWQHVAVARANGSANIYINGIPMATAASASGILSGTLTVGPFTNGLLDEFRISGTVNSSTIQNKTILTIPTSSDITWNINGTTSTGAAVWLPATMWQVSPLGQLKFLFTSSLPGSVIINFFDTSSTPVAIMWSKNGDPVTFTTNGTVVSATLLDTSHDGYLDGINLTWTDAISIVSTFPTVKALVASVIITTLDGKTDTLHPSSLILDAANKTIRVVLTQNTSGYWETGWKNATVLLNNIEITTSGKYFVLGSVIDGATPIPVSSCYEPSYSSTPDLHDSLYVTFSEPLPVTNGPGVDSTNILRYKSSDGSYQSLYNLTPNYISTLSDGRMLFVFPYTTGGTHAIEANIYKLSEKFSTGPNSTLTAAIPLCYPVPYNDTTTYTVLVGPSPYIIGTQSTIKTSDGSVIQATGVKIQIKINQPAIQDTGNGTKDTVIKGTITIFDAVGNVLSNGTVIPDYSGASSNIYSVSFIWPATNKRGSRVAGGTYLGRVTLLNTKSNKKTVQIAKIGIRTSK